MIIHGNSYVDGELDPYYIGIKNGKIDFVKKHLNRNEEVRKFDGVILPGGIDIHVHFRDPGMTKKEDFYTGSKSAAFGGITTVVDMPNNHPPIKTVDNLKKKIEIAKNKSCIDFGLYSLIGTEAEELAELTDLFKIYMASTTHTRKTNVLDGLRKVYEKGCKAAFHCEDEELFRSEGEDLQGYNKYRPPESEQNAIKKLEEYPEGPKHICHITTSKGLDIARSNGYSIEVTPHHLFLNEEAFLGPYGKVNPPLRSYEDQFSLWEAFERGEIDIIASDHAPHLEEEKSEFVDAPAGLPGVETMYPLLLNSTSMGKIPLSRLVEAISENPADYLGIKKGYIKEGYDADFTILDFRDIQKIEREHLHSKCGWSPFEGFNAIFPKHVISRGEYIIKDKEFVGRKGRGNYIFES